MYKIFFMGVLFIVMVLQLVGCDMFNNLKYEPYDPGSEFQPNLVMVQIDAQFQQKLNNQEFTIEDFDWENVDEIGYYQWRNSIASGFEISGRIDVFLKEQGREHIIAAIEHFKTLDFVASAKGKLTFLLDKFTVYIKEDFHQEFIEQQFTLEDFEWYNVESIEYSNSHSSTSRITITLKEEGREQLIDAIDHIRRLYFVKTAEVKSIIYLA